MVEKSWTDGQVQIVRQMWAQGKSCNQIAGEIGKTRNAVIGKVRRLKLPFREGSQWKASKKRTVSPERPAPTVSAAYSLPRKTDVLLILERRKAEAPVLEEPCGGDGPDPKFATLLELEPHQCRWSVAKVEEHLFCGHARSDGSPYCPYHTARAFDGVRRPKQKRAA